MSVNNHQHRGEIEVFQDMLSRPRLSLILQELSVMHLLPTRILNISSFQECVVNYAASVVYTDNQVKIGIHLKQKPISYCSPL